MDTFLQFLESVGKEVLDAAARVIQRRVRKFLESKKQELDKILPPKTESPSLSRNARPAVTNSPEIVMERAVEDIVLDILEPPSPLPKVTNDDIPKQKQSVLSRIMFACVRGICLKSKTSSTFVSTSAKSPV